MRRSIRRRSSRRGPSRPAGSPSASRCCRSGTRASRSAAHEIAPVAVRDRSASGAAERHSQGRERPRELGDRRFGSGRVDAVRSGRDRQPTARTVVPRPCPRLVAAVGAALLLDAVVRACELGKRSVGVAAELGHGVVAVLSQSSDECGHVYVRAVRADLERACSRRGRARSGCRTPGRCAPSPVAFSSMQLLTPLSCVKDPFAWRANSATAPVESPRSCRDCARRGSRRATRRRRCRSPSRCRSRACRLLLDAVVRRWSAA